MKIARLLAGITLLGWVSLSAADTAPVPFIIGGDEIIEPSSVEPSVDLVLPEDPSLPALDEPIAISADPDQGDDMLDLGILEEDLVFEEPSDISEPINETVVVEDDASLPFMLDDLEEDMPQTPSMDDILGGPELDEPTDEPSTIVLTPQMGMIPEEGIVEEQSNQEDVETMFGDLEEEIVLEDDMLKPVEPIVSQPVESEIQESEPVMISLNPSEGEPVGLKTIDGPQEEWGSAYEVSVAPKRVIGPDGSEHIEGLEHIIGRSNPVLQEVKGVRRTIAEVGQGFPALHVDNISITDLLYYLRNFTNKSLENHLGKEMYVSMDIQPESLEDVFSYLSQNYPVEVVDVNNGGFAIIDRSALNQNMIAQNAANASEGLVDGAIAYDLQGNPIMPGDTLDNMMAKTSASESSNMASGTAAAMNGVTGVQNQPLMANQELGMGGDFAQGPGAGMMDANGNIITESMWRDMQRKAHMYELNKRREDLLAERERIEREIRNYHLSRRTD